MAANWSLAELTEFDLHLHRGMSADFQPASSQAVAESDRTATLRAWTLRQSEKHPEARRLVRMTMRSAAWLGLSLWIFSFLAGVSAAAALLRYEGLRLINISAYLGVLVGGQLLMLAALLLGSLFFRRHLLFLQQSLLPTFIRQLPSPQSLPAWRWHLFGMFQRAGTGFNLGVLLLSFWKVATYDLAFGWATTLNTGAESIHRLVQTLALPWGGRFAPTLTQIEQSRIVLKAGLSQIDSASTAAWWPFLFLCVLVYGLLPRLLLSGFAALRLHLLLGHPRLEAPESERLYLALTRKPLLFETDAADPAAGPTLPARLNPLQPSGPLRLQLPEEALPPDQLDGFKQQLTETFHLKLDPQGQGRLIVVEAWQPPLEETLRRFRDLRHELGSQADLLVLAVGLPDRQQSFQAPAAADVENWQRRLSALNDPKLGMLLWRPSP